MGKEPPQERLDWEHLIEVAMTMPGNVGDTYNRFYRYSFLNQVMLMEQGVLEPVATYKRWQELGRQVLKGSKAKAIVRPIIITKKDEQGGVEDTFMRFKPVRCLFGVSETTGQELPPFELPAWSADRALEELKISRVPFQELDGNIQGYSRGREIAINPTAKYPNKTLMHELGHVVLGHTAPDQHDEYVAHRGVREFQAESTAYLSLNELGQLSDEEACVSRGYVQSWLSGNRPGERAVRSIFSAVDTILKAGRESEPV